VFWGTFFSILALVYLWFALVSFSATIREIKNTVGTSFRGANLTNTKFDQLG
jgi:beta-lactam-binding protein with PASTA domain